MKGTVMTQFDEGIQAEGFAIVELRVEVYDTFVDEDGILHVITSNGEYTESDEDVVGMYPLDWIKNEAAGASE